MGVLNATPSEVRATASKVAAKYATTKATIDDMILQVNSVEGFWTSSQADTFIEQLNKVATDYNEFYTKYEAFMTFIGNSMETMDAARDANDAAVSTYASTGGC